MKRSEKTGVIDELKKALWFWHLLKLVWYTAINKNYILENFLMLISKDWQNFKISIRNIDF